VRLFDPTLHQSGAGGTSRRHGLPLFWGKRRGRVASHRWETVRPLLKISWPSACGVCSTRTKNGALLLDIGALGAKCVECVECACCGHALCGRPGCASARCWGTHSTHYAHFGLSGLFWGYSGPLWVRGADCRHPLNREVSIGATSRSDGNCRARGSSFGVWSVAWIKARCDSFRDLLAWRGDCLAISGHQGDSLR
jgi:hypothetical protein